MTATITCLGGAVMNRKYRSRAVLVPGTSNPASLVSSHGGVARNVAETLRRLGQAVSLISAIGNDEAGQAMLAHLHALGVGTDKVLERSDAPTAEYAAMLDAGGDLHAAMAVMDIFDTLTPSAVEPMFAGWTNDSWLFAECNLPADTLALVINKARKSACRLAVDAVSVPKARRLPQDLSGVDVLFANRDEARAILNLEMDDPATLVKGLRQRGALQVVVTAGAYGHWVGTPHGLCHTEARQVESVDVTGAGDALIAGTLHAMARGLPIEDAASIGSALAALTIQTDSDVIPDLSADWLDSRGQQMGIGTTHFLDP